MRIRRKAFRLPVLLLSLLLGLGVVYSGLYPQISRCFFIGFSHFERVGPRIYVSPDTPRPTRELLKVVTERAQSRVADFWGIVIGQPDIIYCHNSYDFARYGSGTPGVAYLNPFNSFVVIGPEGLRTDVMSHELCHVELFDRIGWYKSKYEKPAWFDEGLALMVDYRYSSEETKSRYFGFLVDWDRKISRGFPAIGLDELDTIHDFSKREHNQKIFAYITAGMEVSRWLDIVGHEGLHDLIRHIRDGKEFPLAYTEIEQNSRKQKRRLTWEN